MPSTFLILNIDFLKISDFNSRRIPISRGLFCTYKKPCHMHWYSTLWGMSSIVTAFFLQSIAQRAHVDTHSVMQSRSKTSNSEHQVTRDGVPRTGSKDMRELSDGVTVRVAAKLFLSLHRPGQ
jgi:hypothetical protein